MKKTTYSIVFALLSLTFVSYYSFYDDGTGKEKLLLKSLMQSIRSGHYSPQPVNDEFSEKVFTLYIERIDLNKKIFLKEDIQKLEKYKKLIDDQLNAGSLEFFDLSLELLNKRIPEAQQYYKEALAEPFNFNIDESIELDAEKNKFSTTKDELKNEWRKAMKYQVMNRVLERLDTQEKLKEKNDTSTAVKTFDELEKESREKILKNHEDWIARLQKLNRTDRLNIFLNCIANVNDPHTEYFPPADKENFDIGMSGQLQGIGAQLSEKDGQIEVTHIVPGSPSYRQGILKEGDIILKVAQGDDEPVDIVDMRLDNAVKLIRGPKGTKVRLTIKKKLDGSIEEISIIRDVVILEDTYAKSAIIEMNGARYGYIFLPKFYADFQHTGGRTCSRDIQAELEKLKAEKVKGIVFDLRNNGGGSLNDVVDMAGLFIDKGPVVQVKSRSGSPYEMNDRNGGIVYDGPMVMMVNTFSASASEILAAAMQDYKRAVIVGSPSTFGKGTVQQFVMMDDFVSKEEKSSLSPADAKYVSEASIKLTMRKFYRINGGTTQLKGVIPDIILPDAFSYIDIGEKEQEYPMKWDEIKALPYTPYSPVSWKLDMAALAAKSKRRTDTNSVLKLYEENAQRVKQLKDKTLVSLNMEKYKEEQNKLKEEAKKYEDIEKTIQAIKPGFLQQDLYEMQNDTAKVSREKKWLEKLTKDSYLYESLLITSDMGR